VESVLTQGAEHRAAAPAWLPRRSERQCPLVGAGRVAAMNLDGTRADSTRATFSMRHDSDRDLMVTLENCHTDGAPRACLAASEPRSSMPRYPTGKLRHRLDERPGLHGLREMQLEAGS
jgi:hypothetical protein